MQKISFISGHLDLTQKEFDENYKEQIDEAVKRNDHFVIGDCKGTDLMAQQYLASLGICNKSVTVYHMFTDPRNNFGKYLIKGGYTDDEQRDCMMTHCSDQDILWVRSAEEMKQRLGKKYRPGRVSGTEKNRLRRIIKNEAKVELLTFDPK